MNAGWTNLPIYAEVLSARIKGRGCVYDGQNLMLTDEGIILSYPVFEPTYFSGTFEICLNPNYIYNRTYWSKSVISARTGYGRTTGDNGYATLLLTDNGYLAGEKDGITGLYYGLYKLDSPYFHTSRTATSSDRTNLGTLSGVRLHSVEVFFKDALPDTTAIQLQAGSYLSAETYYGVGAGTSLLFTFPEVNVDNETLQFKDDTDGTIAKAVAKADRYEVDYSAFYPNDYPAININGTYMWRPLDWTGQYLVGYDKNSPSTLVYTALPYDAKSLYVGETIKYIGHWRDSLFVITDESVYEVDLQREAVRRIGSALPRPYHIKGVLSHDLGVFAYNEDTVYIITTAGLQPVVRIADAGIERLTPSWNTRTFYICGQSSLWEATLGGVWKVKADQNIEVVKGCGKYVWAGYEKYELSYINYSSQFSELTLATDILPTRLSIYSMYCEATYPEDIQIEVEGLSDNVSTKGQVVFDGTTSKSVPLSRQSTAIASGQQFLFRFRGKGEVNDLNLVRQLWIYYTAKGRLPSDI